MIKIQNIQDLPAYLAVPREALDFVRGMTAETPDGRYEFGEDCFAQYSVPFAVDEDNSLPFFAEYSFHGFIEFIFI